MLGASEGVTVAVGESTTLRVIALRTMRRRSTSHSRASTIRSTMPTHDPATIAISETFVYGVTLSGEGGGGLAISGTRFITVCVTVGALKPSRSV